ncbi:phage tail protein [Larsenimonas suaedae]|uniref:Phage tail protein n=1 Tax=Larsenimonas suaedae TaxID=1851019 RepID=A0ABU1GYK1_9GAMM|nr:phage tail protein [Larsenimonas suaedae]MCM2973503.1 phage tail protein [Larsenimonas suaedae]MDR5897127.1 phage tail protein [Larsenimonas suaedae]
MKKLTALRQYLIDAVPHLQRDPDGLLTFVEDGTIEFSAGPTLSHGYTFTAQLVLTDFADDVDTVMVPLLDWLAVYQPDLAPAEAVRFEAEVLSNSAVDLALRVQLTERVIAKKDCDTGKISVEHRMPRFDVDTCGPRRWQLMAEDHHLSGYAAPESTDAG